MTKEKPLKPGKRPTPGKYRAKELAAETAAEVRKQRLNDYPTKEEPDIYDPNDPPTDYDDPRVGFLIAMNKRD